MRTTDKNPFATHLRTLKMTCRNYVYCNRPDCARRHFQNRTFDERMAMLKVKDDCWEELKQFEPEAKTTAKPCLYFLMCFEKECQQYHGGLSHDARKMLRKKTDKHFKNAEKEERVAIAVGKMVEQIEAMSLGQVKPLNWADEC